MHLALWKELKGYKEIQYSLYFQEDLCILICESWSTSVPTPTLPCQQEKNWKCHNFCFILFRWPAGYCSRFPGSGENR